MPSSDRTADINNASVLVEQKACFCFPSQRDTPKLNAQRHRKIFTLISSYTGPINKINIKTRQDFLQVLKFYDINFK